MRKTLGIVHTSFALVDLLNGLARQRLPGVGLVNIVDDTLLVYAREHGIDERLRRRMLRCFEAAAAAGADLILNACSTVGETVDSARPHLATPILKIDDAMAEQAVSLGQRIGVFATVASTLGPTAGLLQAKAAAAGRTIEMEEHLCDGCFDLLLAGKTAEHDERVTRTVLAAAPRYDVLVFAQASMSRLAPVIAPQVKPPLLASPELALQQVAAALGGR
jgi:hypothetical protein